MRVLPKIIIKHIYQIRAKLTERFIHHDQTLSFKMSLGLNTLIDTLHIMHD